MLQLVAQLTEMTTTFRKPNAGLLFMIADVVQVMIEDVQVAMDNQVKGRMRRAGRELVHDYNVYHTIEEVNCHITSLFVLPISAVTIAHLNLFRLNSGWWTYPLSTLRW